MTILKDYPLLRHNTFGIACEAERYAEYGSEEELRQLLAERPKRVLHIGGGSNLLFLKPRFEGLVLHSGIRTVELLSETEGEALVRVGGGYVWDDLVSLAISRGWHGLENLSLIPGEAGAAAVQNIGAYGREAGDFIEEVEGLSLETLQSRTFSRSECAYSYRSSLFKTPRERGRWAVIRVTFRLSKRFAPRLDHGGLQRELRLRGIAEASLTPEGLRSLVIEIRRSKLPDAAVTGNAGSFFKNPVVGRAQFERLRSEYPELPHYEAEEGRVKLPAAWLIEQCGWKGRALGKAAVHSRQALVLVNLGGATGEEVLALCRAVQADVSKRFGIALEPEVNIIA
ncbi:MAG: UDP-N-acetylmuramate dehydrogenase [Prevotellaceae bacterium]|nr:UDP-N-acetylmuramate dehydrogenase [Prevotellaceae bacterium]